MKNKTIIILALYSSALTLVFIYQAISGSKLHQKNNLEEIAATKIKMSGGVQEAPVALPKIASMENRQSPLPADSKKNETSEVDPEAKAKYRAALISKKLNDLDINLKPRLKDLGLSETQWQLYKKAIHEIEETQFDSQELIENQNLSQKDAEKIMKEFSDQARQQIIAAVGIDASKRIIDINRDVPLTVFAGELVKAMAYTSEPLTIETQKAYLDAIRANAATTRRDTAGNMYFSDEQMKQFKVVLSPTQFDVLAASQANLRVQRDITKYTPKPMSK